MKQHTLGEVHKAVLAGIYCLLQDDTIVYIGQSNSVIRRIGWHLGANKKIFNQFSYVVLEDRRDDLEAELIERFQPKYNILGNPKFWRYKKSTWDRKNRKRRNKDQENKKKQTKKNEKKRKANRQFLPR